ncbi:MAG TPA: serine/threonine-protein kinase [Polyangia bacterium]|nr:serine/threonine-protein kinase [Polyangia bacterium]
MKKPIPFGKYYLLERINVGGMAEVFKAKAFGVEGFERMLAVKRILPNIAEDEEFITMFIDEAKIAVQLQHANIAQIFDLGKVDESYFIALEYVNGRDLRSIFDRARAKGEVMPIRQACYVVMQVCEGLDYAHNKRDGQGRELHLVHRDISPQNVLVGYEGEIKLIDFGIAKAAGKASKTQAGILKGKFGYMSPEQVRGLPIDRRSDIFSVGIVLYEMLTNERLFVGESDFSTLEKVRNVEIMPPSSYNRNIPGELERISLKALAKDPEDRYQNAIDLHDDLQAFLYTVGELYSRKDLAAWMKKMFATEIEDDNAKIEQFRQIAAPSSRKDADDNFLGAASGNGAKKVKKSVPDSPMGWDDEELDTQIFDKEPSDEIKTLETEDLFYEDDDRTVANQPAPDILRAATAPDLVATPKPRLLAKPTAGHGSGPAPGSSTGGGRGIPGPGGSGSGPVPAPRPVRAPASPRQTLMGMPAPGLPSPLSRPPADGGGLPPPGHGAALRPKTQPSMPVSSHVPPAGPAAPAPMASGSSASHPAFSFESPAPFGSGSFLTGGPERNARGGKYAAMVFLALLVIGGTVAYWYYSSNKPGQVQIATVPSDATVLIDNVKVADHSPVTIEKPLGQYTLSVTHDGYVRSDQNIEVKAGQPVALNIALEPSPDTGFELTSDPPGGMVWLDGAVINGANGPARTDFRAYRIPPGHHVIEIKGESRFKPWKQDIEIEPGSIRKVHATLVQVGAGAGSAEREPSKPAPKPEPTPVVAAAPAPIEAPPPPPPRPTVAVNTPPPSPPSTSKPPSTASSETGAGTASSSGSSNRSSSTTSPGSSRAASTPSVPAVARRRRDTTDDDSTPTSSPKGIYGESGDCVITVGSRPWSEVWIDGKNTTKHTPIADLKVPCGRHRLGFKRPDLQIDRTESITVRSGEKFKQVYTLTKEADF